MGHNQCSQWTSSHQLWDKVSREPQFHPKAASHFRKFWEVMLCPLFRRNSPRTYTALERYEGLFRSDHLCLEALNLNCIYFTQPQASSTCFLSPFWITNLYMPLACCFGFCYLHHLENQKWSRGCPSVRKMYFLVKFCNTIRRIDISFLTAAWVSFLLCALMCFWPSKVFFVVFFFFGRVDVGLLVMRACTITAVEIKSPDTRAVEITMLVSPH